MRILSTQKLHGLSFLESSFFSQNIWDSCIKTFWVEIHGTQDILQIIISPDDLGIELMEGPKEIEVRVCLGRAKPSSFEHGAIIILNPRLNTAPS